MKQRMFFNLENNPSPIQKQTGEVISLHLQYKQNREDSETDEPDPDLEDGDPQPSQQLLLSE